MLASIFSCGALCWLAAMARAEALLAGVAAESGRLPEGRAESGRLPDGRPEGTWSLASLTELDGRRAGGACSGFLAGSLREAGRFFSSRIPRRAPATPLREIGGIHEQAASRVFLSQRPAGAHDDGKLPFRFVNF